MAVEHASELASIVASYLRKHGFAKTLSAFLRENDGIVQETDIVDLETLYKLHISTHANGASKTKKSKKAKLEDGPRFVKGDEDVRDDAEEKALANLYVNGGSSSEKKKKKKGERENVAVDPLIDSEVDQTGAGKAEAKMSPKEKKDSKKKRKEEKLEKDDVSNEGLKAEGEKFSQGMVGTPGTVKHSVEEAKSNGHAAACDSALKKSSVGNRDQKDGGGLTTQQEVPHFEKTPNKKSKKERKEQAGEQPPGNETPILKETRPVDIAQVLSQEDGLSKKKRKKSKDAGGPNTGKEETNDIAESVSEVPISIQTEKVDVTRPQVELSHDPEGCETGSKKKKRRKELSSEAAGDVNGSLQEPFDAKLDVSKNYEGNIESKKQSGKKRKSKENTPVNEISNQEYDNLNTSPEKTKETGEGEGVDDRNVEMNESGSSKTPNDKKTPTGAMAFKRVEVEKVSFSDPRLSDNSYWAKDGAEEGYGAKAQEVLGLVRGRDFRHEKTKKKRGSYRGGLIGLQSHSIKFENSDDD